MCFWSEHKIDIVGISKSSMVGVYEIDFNKIQISEANQNV